MLLDVTLEYMKFRETLILLQLSLDYCSLILLWSLSKRDATVFVSAIPRQDVSFSPLSLLNFYFYNIILGSFAHIDMNC